MTPDLHLDLHLAAGHVDVITAITRLVRTRGAAAALDELRRQRPALSTQGYHDTLAVFIVWAIDRLAAAGLSDTRILWHPLADLRSASAWWDADTLASIEAHGHFVPSTLATSSDPTPSEPVRSAAAA
jgi:hypothetical protein